MGKKNLPVWHEEFSDEARDLTLPEIGLKLITTIDPRGWPHITMISFNKAKTKDQIVWGKFTHGLSKKYVTQTKKQGMFFMNDKAPFVYVQAKAEFDYLLHEGEDCEEFSRGHMLRYMTYTNVDTCFYNKVIGATDVQNLSMGGIVKGFLTQALTKGGVKSIDEKEKLNDFAFDLFNQMTSAKFISYIDSKDGYPVTIPCFELRAPNRNLLAFPYSQCKEQLDEIPLNSHVAIFGVVTENLELLNLMVNGRLVETKKIRGIKWGIIDIDEIYNSMPPLTGVIYPKLQIREKVTDFTLE